MSDERSTFETTRARLEDIVSQARRKDVSLEQSLDLLEEAVRLVNQCNELIDQTSFRAGAVGDEDGEVVVTVAEADTDADGVTDVMEVVQTVDSDGDGVPDVVEVVDLVDTDGDGIADVRIETVSLRGDGEGADGDAADALDDDARE